MGKTAFTVGNDNKTLTMERTFDAPQDKLWRAYSEKEVFEQWFAPHGWEVTSKKFDFSDGGENIYVMKCVDKSQGDWYGQTSAGKMVFSDINPKDSFAYADYFTDEEGNINNEMPASKTDLQLIANDNGTTTLRASTSYSSAEELKQVIEMGMEEGYNETLDKLEAVVTDN